LDFGADYKRESTSLELARDLEFIIIPSVNYFDDGGGISDVNISYRVTLRIDPNDNAEEIRKTLNMVKSLNKNPEEIKEAAREIIEVSIEPALEESEKTKKDMLDGSMATTYINVIDRRYGQRAVDGDLEAEKATLLAKWAQANWGHMDVIEKTALINTYLYPMSQGALSLVHLQIVMESASGQIGQPVGWENDVKEELRYRGSGGMVRNQYKWKGTGATQDTETNADDSEVEKLRGTVGAPVPAGSMRPAGDYGAPNTNLEEALPHWIETPERCEENQIERIAKLLEKRTDPKYDLRIYRIQIGCGIVDGVGGSDSELGAEIRGINGVTTVRPLAETKRRITPTENYQVFEVKFELLGAQSRIDYRDQVLLPQMRLIKGLKIVDWTAIHKTNIQGTIRTVREGIQRLSEQGWGSGMGSSLSGKAANLGSVRHSNTPGRPTPTPTLDAIVQDWAEGGVQVYDFPTNTNAMQYHTMLPVEELWQHRSRIMRYPKDIFDAKYQQFDAVYQPLKDTLADPAAYQEFIKVGARMPIYVAIGQNGKVKITGNEDLIWFAKKSGLKEVPVFLSYQRQI